jgi:hypothetical protein
MSRCREEQSLGCSTEKRYQVSGTHSSHVLWRRHDQQIQNVTSDLVQPESRWPHTSFLVCKVGTRSLIFYTEFVSLWKVTLSGC